MVFKMDFESFYNLMYSSYYNRCNYADKNFYYVLELIKELKDYQRGDIRGYHKYSIKQEKLKCEEIKKEIEELGKQTIDIYGCKFTINPDDTYTCSCKHLKTLSQDVLHEIVKRENSHWKYNYIAPKIKYFNGIEYIRDQKLLEKINGITVKKIKNKLSKNSIIFASIYGELEKKGYSVPRLTDYDITNDKDFDLKSFYKEWINSQYFSELKRFLYFDELGKTIFDRENYTNILNDIQDDSECYFNDIDDEEFNIIFLIDIIKNTLGVSSKEYKELLKCFSDYNHQTMEMHKNYINDIEENSIDNVEVNNELDREGCRYIYNLIVQTFQVSVINGEKLYLRHILNNNKNITLSLKQAYKVLSEEDKEKIAEDLWGPNAYLPDSSYTNAIIEVFQQKCRSKEGKKYSRDEIKNFLHQSSYYYNNRISFDSIVDKLITEIESSKSFKTREIFETPEEIVDTENNRKRR